MNESLLVVLFLALAGIAAGQQNCYIKCDADQLSGSSPQAVQRQGPPGKRGPHGPAGMKGEKGNPGEFYSDADELLELKNKFGSLFELTTQLQQNFTSKQLQLEAELNAAKDELDIVNNLLSGSRVCAVGVADSGIIADHQLSASSTYSNDYTPQHARLRLTSGAGAWTVSKGNRRVGEWLQVDLEVATRLTGVATQGSFRAHAEYVTSYKIEFKTEDSKPFNVITDDENNIKIFPGNTDYNTIVLNKFDKAITARYFRILPTTWNNWPALRIELYIC